MTSLPHGRLNDSYGRSVNYIRLSVTDRCNLRCLYCFNKENAYYIPHPKILSYEEMTRVVRICERLGVNKVRLTGGEPLVRKNFLHFVEMLKESSPSVALRLTTNATLLADKLDALKDLGLMRLNISLDTLDRDKFQSITGRDFLPRVLTAVDRAVSKGFRVKINAVALKGVNDGELFDFINLARNFPIDVRYIEFMPMGGCSRWSFENFWSANDILASAKSMADLVPASTESAESRGPAKMYEIKGGLGRFGLITPLSHHFCRTCNRLRLTSDGKLRTCLFSDKEYRLRSLLRSPRINDDMIAKVIAKANTRKPLGFEILDKRGRSPVAQKQMSSIGG
ncbi:GTP 3',8-cyclase MoaA [Desulfovibrio inopinatus]|uniref:GTP 3',8-cyclase MoaA n=1 Tax=Desulfovibrio inopinatus TaxID=102109 RepID=UPI00040BE581|nr:GTP 3',8-cyclase MoaA [Desulfovibrio inopinatus]